MYVWYGILKWHIFIISNYNILFKSISVQSRNMQTFMMSCFIFFCKGLIFYVSYFFQLPPSYIFVLMVVFVSGPSLVFFCAFWILSTRLSVACAPFVRILLCLSEGEISLTSFNCGILLWHWCVCFMCVWESSGAFHLISWRVRVFALELLTNTASFSFFWSKMRYFFFLQHIFVLSP